MYGPEATWFGNWSGESRLLSTRHTNGSFCVAAMAIAGGSKISVSGLRVQNISVTALLFFICAANAKTVSMLRDAADLPSCFEAIALLAPLPDWCSLLRARIVGSDVPLIKLATKLLCSMAMQSFARRCAPAPTRVASKPKTELPFPAVRSFCIRSASMRHFTMAAYSSFSFASFKTGRISGSFFCFFAEVFFADGLGAGLVFVPGILPFCFLAVAAGLFFFLRGMSLIILPHDNFCFTEMFLL